LLPLYRFIALSFAAHSSDPALKVLFNRGQGGRSVRKVIPTRLKLKANHHGAQVKGDHAFFCVYI